MRYWLWLLGVVSTSVLSAPIQKVLPLTVTIDKAQLYPYTLSLEVQPSSFTLLFDEESRRFQSDDVAVIISTDIPGDESGADFEYRLSLVNNDSRCWRSYDEEETAIVEGFISLTLDGTPFAVGDVLEAQTLDEVDSGVLGANRELRLDSEVISEESLQCDGLVRLEAELAL